MTTRRDFCGWFCAALGLGMGARKALAAATSVLPGAARSSVRTYRADAVVTVLGVPVFARRDVGGGFAAVRESRQGENRVVTLHFAGGSNPERTHGLTYNGSIEEVVLEHGSAAVEAASFGFVTAASSDEKYDQARQRIFSKASGPSDYVAVQGLHRGGYARYEKGSISLSVPHGQDLEALDREIRSQFVNAERTTREVRVAGNSTAATFLYSILTALRSGDVRSQLGYVHNAKEYRMELEKAADPHAGAALLRSGLTNHPDSVMRCTGQVHDVATRKVSTFRFWLDGQSELPLRIEYQPRSYLRIHFEYEPAKAQPNNSRTEET